MPTLTLYHGTAHDFPAFDKNFDVRGSDPNSALGIHLSEYPGIAAEYAGMSARDVYARRPVVLVVEADVERAIVCGGREEFFGYDPMEVDELTGDWEAVSGPLRHKFMFLRMKLMADGFDAVACDDIGDDLAGGWVVFDPARLRIVGRLTLEEAYESEASTDTTGVRFESGFTGPEWDFGEKEALLPS
jgi:hypothetical protein